MKREQSANKHRRSNTPRAVPYLNVVVGLSSVGHCKVLSVGDVAWGRHDSGLQVKVVPVRWVEDLVTVLRLVLGERAVVTWRQRKLVASVAAGNQDGAIGGEGGGGVVCALTGGGMACVSGKQVESSSFLESSGVDTGNTIRGSWQDSGQGRVSAD